MRTVSRGNCNRDLDRKIDARGRWVAGGGGGKGPIQTEEEDEPMVLERKRLNQRIEEQKKQAHRRVHATCKCMCADIRQEMITDRLLPKTYTVVQ